MKRAIKKMRLTSLKLNRMKRILFIFMLLPFLSMSQVEKSSKLYKALKVNDSLIFNASFNTCNLEELTTLINDDLEFYHDKAGLIEGKDTFIENTKNGLCKSPNELRRELNKESLEVFALHDNKGKLYAAIQKGVYSFYENDKKGSTAKFTHLWILKKDRWFLKRVLSYDHKEPSMNSGKKEISISADILMKYAGEYEAPQTGKVMVAVKNNSLNIYNDKMQMKVFPESETNFYSKEKPLVFQFIKDVKGNVLKMVVVENGSIVEEANKIK